MLVLSGRESTQSEIPDKVLEYVSQHGRKVYERKYVVLDEQYRMFKSKILKCDTYDAKFTIVKYNLDISL